MESSKRLADRFEDVFLSGKWIANTNINEVLSDISWQEANTKIGSLNTIGLLTFHLNYYVQGVLQVLQGGELTIRDKFSFDAPPIESVDEWEDVKKNFFSNVRQFSARIHELSEADLARPFVKEEYGDYRRNIEGMIEHTYYHFGQISLLKKLVRSEN